MESRIPRHSVLPQSCRRSHRDRLVQGKTALWWRAEKGINRRLENASYWDPIPFEFSSWIKEIIPRRTCLCWNVFPFARVRLRFVQGDFRLGLKPIYRPMFRRLYRHSHLEYRHCDGGLMGCGVYSRSDEWCIFWNCGSARRLRFPIGWGLYPSAVELLQLVVISASFVISLS